MGLILISCDDKNNDNPPDNPPVDPTPSKIVLTDYNVITENPIKEEKVEFALYEAEVGYIDKNFNPYDYTQINVYADIISPTNEIVRVFGFWYRDYEITINTAYKGNVSGVSGTASTNSSEVQGLEQVKWLSNDYHFRFRFTPTETGTHSVTVKVEENGKVVQKIENNILINDNSSTNYRGIMQVDSTNNRHFVDGLGDTFVPVGINLCWWTHSLRKSYDYDVWFENLSANGGNFTRLWMATWGFCQHWNTIDDYNSSQNMAARLDKVMEIADDYDIYLQLCLLNHGQFSSATNSEWDNNPYNVKNGGILTSPAQFFVNEEAKRIYKMELRYLVARYGYSDHLLAWELFNEVDWTDGAESYNQVNIRKWHQEMATFINENDPYNHMITTSYKYFYSSWNLAFSLEEIDFASVHSYDFSNVNVNTKLPADMVNLSNKYNKPVHTGEIGIDWQSGQSANRLDPTGISIRQALWAGMMSGSVGGAMQWWWDSWIHPNNLYHLYQGAGIYGEKLNLSGDDYSLLADANYTLSNDNVGLIGYKFNDRIYGYVFNNAWTYYNSTPGIINSLSINIPFTNGTYTLIYYNTLTGEVISSSSINVDSGICNIAVPTFNEDIAFIIE